MRVAVRVGMKEFSMSRHFHVECQLRVMYAIPPHARASCIMPPSAFSAGELSFDGIGMVELAQVMFPNSRWWKNLLEWQYQLDGLSHVPDPDLEGMARMQVNVARMAGARS